MAPGTQHAWVHVMRKKRIKAKRWRWRVWGSITPDPGMSLYLQWGIIEYRQCHTAVKVKREALHLTGMGDFNMCVDCWPIDDPRILADISGSSV